MRWVRGGETGRREGGDHTTTVWREGGGGRSRRHGGGRGGRISLGIEGEERGRRRHRRPRQRCRLVTTVSRQEGGEGRGLVASVGRAEAAELIIGLVVEAVEGCSVFLQDARRRDGEVLRVALEETIETLDGGGVRYEGGTVLARALPRDEHAVLERGVGAGVLDALFAGLIARECRGGADEGEADHDEEREGGHLEMREREFEGNLQWTRVEESRVTKHD
ncbi:hypothetical protein PMAYCL1PPCAC_28177, partial [Pristionchus mayeri]